MKKPKLWYVIADGGRARFVERDDQGAFRTLSSFVSTELHKSAHELGRDRPVRVKESASPARSAIEPRRDLHEAAKEDFIRAVAETLNFTRAAERLHLTQSAVSHQIKALEEGLLQ